MLCTVCSKEFDYPDFKCKKQPGNHSVESKTYYHLGGREVADPKDRRKFAPVIVLVPSYDYRDPETQKFVKTEGITVQFYDGKYETANAEEQYHLDRKAKSDSAMVSGKEGHEQWCAIYLTPQQNIDRQRDELASLQKQVMENSDLLAKVKAQQENKKANG